MYKVENEEMVIYLASLCDFHILFDEDPLREALNNLDQNRLHKLGKRLESVLQGNEPKWWLGGEFFNPVVMHLLEKYAPKYIEGLSVRRKNENPLKTIARTLRQFQSPAYIQHYQQDKTLLMTLCDEIYTEAINLYEKYLISIIGDCDISPLPQINPEEVRYYAAIEADERKQLLLFPEDSHDNYLPF